MVPTTLLSLLAIFLVGSLAQQTVPVLDLMPLLNGFGSVVPRGAQRFWVDQQTIYLRIDSVPTGDAGDDFPIDHLWELNIHSDRLSVASQGCSYSAGWAQLPTTGGSPHKHPIRSGNLGSTEASSTNGPGASSHIVYVRGDEFPSQGFPRSAATHIYFTFEHCYVSRYLQRSQFNQWNGGAYLMDLGVKPIGRSWAAPGLADQTIRWENLLAINASTTNPSNAAFNRDSTITAPGAGWWGGAFYIDTSSLSVSNPVLDLWGVIADNEDSAREQFLGFGQCIGAPCNDRSLFHSGSGWFLLAGAGSTEADSFHRFYFDVAQSRAGDDFSCFFDSVGNATSNQPAGCAGNFPPLVPSAVVQVIGNDFAFPPYAKLWDPSLITASPMLFNIITGAPTQASCSIDAFGLPVLNFTGGLARSTSGSLSQLLCSYTSSILSVSFTFPTSISEWPYTWFLLSDLGSPTSFQAGYRVTATGIPGTLFEVDIPSGNNPGASDFDRNHRPTEYQIAVTSDEIMPVNTQVTISGLAGADFAINGWIQIHAGLPNPCATNPCANGACSPGWFAGHAFCSCFDGWQGDLCDQDTVECEFASCLNDGLCVDNLGAPGFTCNCTDSWEGPRCEKAKTNCPVTSEVDGVMTDVCLNGGLCISVVGSNSFRCDCTGTDFHGAWCEMPNSDCSLDPMLCGQGVCSAIVDTGSGNFNCACNAGWTKKSGSQVCDTPVVCAPNPCQGGGLCQEQGGVAVCTCTSTRYGDRCEYSFEDDKRENDCRYSFTPCSSNAQCRKINDAGDDVWRCVCDAYWTGPFCNVHTACADGAGGPVCKNNGACMVDMEASIPDYQKTAICQCTGNFFGDTCEESLRDYFDDCRFSAKPCENNGVCSLVSGAYQCINCDPGFHGLFCELADVCVGNGPCGANGVCSRGADGMAHCTCTGAFTGPTCAILAENWITQRFDEYTNDCRFSSLQCMNGGECVKRADASFACVCGAGSAYTGSTCETPKVCEPNPCMNGGSCDLFNGAAICHCTGGYVGASCQWSLDEYFTYDCRLRPCENGGSCTSDGKCVCDTNKWVGDWCEDPVVCQGHQCNGGECIAINGQASCLCPGDKFGDECEFDIETGLSDCRTNPCMNGGICAEFGQTNRYVCNCATTNDNGGWTGERCEVSRHCNPNPCQNGGKCKEFAGSFACLCADDFTGTTCSTSLADRLNEINTKLEEDVEAQVQAELTKGVSGSFITVSADVTTAGNDVLTLRGQVEALTAQLDSLDQDNKQTSSAVESIFNNFARKSETDEIHDLLTELLSPASTVFSSLGLLLSALLFAFFNKEF